MKPRPMPAPDSQTTGHVLMIEPVGFTANPQTLQSNRFQESATGADEAAIRKMAAAESRALRAALADQGITVTCLRGRADCPDDLFCNNWVSTHGDGALILYPMRAENRRKERRADIAALLKKSYPVLWDMTNAESEDKALESTGSLVLDRVNRVAYAALSSRTDENLVRAWCNRRGYAPILFRTADEQGAPVYHTNVMMFIGTKIAGICDAVIRDETERARVLGHLSRTHDVILLTPDQIRHFCGNALELHTHRGETQLIMSGAARAALRPDQITKIEKSVDGILSVPIPTIERYGGGSVRCMLLELF